MASDKPTYEKVEENGKGVYCRFYKNEKFDKNDPNTTQPVGSVFFTLNGKTYRAGLWQEKPDDNGEKRCDYSGRVEVKVVKQDSSSSQAAAPSTAADDDIPF